MSNDASKTHCFRDWFNDAIKLFESQSEAERVEALTAALAFWRGHPLIAEGIECLDSVTDEDKYKLRHDLNSAHYRSTERLMQEAELAGLNPAPLREEFRVCQELFNPIRGTGQFSSPFGIEWFHHPNRNNDLWPDCLGPWRYALPPAMQEAIRQGEEVLTQLVVRWDVSQVSIGERVKNQIAAECRTVALPGKTKGKKINAKMLGLLSKDQDYYSWTAEQWAAKLDCTAGTVKGTPAWKQIIAFRASMAAEMVANTGAYSGGKRRKQPR
jgi:hypothetical protein